MIRCDYGADSIVWIKEGVLKTNPSRIVLIRAPKTILFSGFFLRINAPLPRTLTFFRAPKLSRLCGAFLSLMRSKILRSLSRWLSLASLLLVVPLWAFIVRVSGLPKFILPSPTDVWIRFLSALSDGSLLRHTAFTLTEILLGLLVGVSFATIVGYALAKSRALEIVFAPYLVASQAVPIAAIAPLLVIWLGNGVVSKVVTCALIVFFPVLVNTVVGVRAVSQSLYDLMNSLGATRWQILWKLELPASLPVLLGGLRIGATLSVIGAIIGELVGAQKGLGFLLQLGNFQYDTSMVFVAVFMLIALALGLYGIVALFEKKFLKWQKS